MATITVTILPGGKKAKEVNPIRRPTTYTHPMDSRSMQEVAEDYIKKSKLWQSAEDKLRTFDIEGVYHLINGRREFVLLKDSKWIPDLSEEYSAEIINKTQIRIV